MKTIAGKILGEIGLICVPLSFGILLGYFFSDRGVRFLPTTLGFVLLILVVGLGLIPIGRILRGKAFKESKENLRIRKRIWVATALAAVAVMLRLVVYGMSAPAPLTALSHHDFNLAFRIDRERFESLERQLESAAIFLESHRKTMGKDSGVLEPEEEYALREAWGTVNNTAFAIDQIRVFYEDWYRYDPSRLERNYHIRAFLLAFVSELTLYEKSLRIVGAVKRNPNAEKFLDSPQPSIGLSNGSFSRYQQELIGSRDVARVLAGQQYMGLLEEGFDGRNESQALGVYALWEKSESTLGVLKTRSTFRKAASTLTADMQSLKRRVRRKWFPAQTSVARFMGNTKLRRIGNYLIPKTQRDEAEKRLAPGDILLARKNWYLSNVGLPGFWPHAMLYLGDAADLDRHFDDPEIRAHIQKISGGKSQTLSQHLAAHWPRVWAAYALNDAKEPPRVIEATSEGVVFSAMGSISGDYFAALRPRLSALDKAQAIIAAFSHYGKPYDFNFDFATDHALVCTELVWRSYRESEGKMGLNLPLVAILGRKTLPANEIVRLFAKERGTDTAQLEFVYFIDANEKEQKTFVSSEPAFIASHKRTKWDFVLP